VLAARIDEQRRPVLGDARGEVLDRVDAARQRLFIVAIFTLKSRLKMSTTVFSSVCARCFAAGSGEIRKSAFGVLLTSGAA
jgi:hypothetical protein